MRTIAETLRWKTWEQQFEEYLKTRVMTDDALDDDIRRQSILDQEEKEFNSAPPHKPMNETNNSESIAEPTYQGTYVQTLFVKPLSEPKCGNCGKVFSTSIRFNHHQKHCRRRLNQCGRVDYRQEDLATHLADRTTHQCRGTLHLLPWFKCPYCSQLRRFTTEQSLSDHINAKHAKEAINDVKTWRSNRIYKSPNFYLGLAKIKNIQIQK